MVSVVSVVSLALLCGCIFGTDRTVETLTAPRPSVPWRPTAEEKTAAREAVRPAVATPILPAFLASETGGGVSGVVSLPQIVDVALQNNPATRAAWHQARAAAADLGSKRGAYFPSLELDAQLSRQKQVALGGRSIFIQTSYGPTASLSYLLLDFGGRAADVAEAREVLRVADWTHDATIQNVVLNVEQAYYQFLYAKALAQAQGVSVKQAETTLDAAKGRHDAGLATIADVLQAQTALSQARLSLQTFEGQVQTIRGALATAAGVPANIPIEVGNLPEVNVTEVGESVDQLIARAEDERPDLAAARSSVRRAASHVRSVAAQGLPTLSAAASYGRSYFPGSDASVAFADSYTAALLFRFPVFTGFSKAFDVRRANEELHAAEAQAEGVKDRAILEVWTSYFDQKTAVQRAGTARDLLVSATQSEQVASERYKAGVGSLIDLLTAESALAGARAQEVQARADWFLSLARLAHDTGVLGARAPEETSNAPAETNKDREPR
jgi:outer membrane protein